VLHVPTAQPVVAGASIRAMRATCSQMLDRACDGCTNGEFAAMVTAPVQKSTLMDAGFAFTGHTEYLAARTRAALPVMMLLSGTLRVALVTTHLPLAEVPRPSPASACSPPCASCTRIWSATSDLAPAHRGARPQSARRRIRTSGPRRNRRDRARDRAAARRGIDLRGPVPADTAFTPQFLVAGADVIVAMYHDQGCP
jgi:4-hydroxythreonine-4-phosphate dehydrogenase